jgi:pyridoxamine 5'-phosphate oxidase
MNPFQIFLAAHGQELLKSKLRIPSACCLSTIGLDGYPNARFVAFKEMKNEAFIVCGPLHSRKSVEMTHDPKVALTFWWTATEIQVRIQGDAVQIPASDADKYFRERAREVQIISLVSMQGQPVEDMEALNSKLLEKEAALENEDIQRPENWGGYAINPLRIEFLEFNSSRFHKRTLFQKEGDLWTMKLLQP